jgi:hypothetical protein
MPRPVRARHASRSFCNSIDAKPVVDLRFCGGRVSVVPAREIMGAAPARVTEQDVPAVTAIASAQRYCSVIGPGVALNLSLRGAAAAMSAYKDACRRLGNWPD